MRVTSKGQVTIPQEFREKAGIHPGTEIEFTFIKGEIVIRKRPGPGRGAALVRQLTGAGDVKMTTDEIMQLTRGDR